MKPAPETSSRERALSCLQGFKSRSLPALQRRLACWKGLQTRRHGDVIDDLLQDLALDCLENAELILALGERERHGRWFRLLQKRHYQLRLRSARLCEVREELDRLPSGPARISEQETDEMTGLDLPSELRSRIRLLQERGVHLKNGRLNLERSAASTGLPREGIRRSWWELSAALGYGQEYREFWTRRLAEALLALAADQLQDAGALQLNDRPNRRRPAPQESLRRVLGIRDSLASLPQAKGMRRLLAGLGGRRRPSPADPRALLELAAELRGNDAVLAAWRFEAAIAYGDHQDAVIALRAARRHGAGRVSLTLCRARLAESRGRLPAAAAILRRAQVRCPNDARIAASLLAVAGPNQTPAIGSSAAEICSRISRSQV